MKLILAIFLIVNFSMTAKSQGNIIYDDEYSTFWIEFADMDTHWVASDEYWNYKVCDIYKRNKPQNTYWQERMYYVEPLISDNGSYTNTSDFDTLEVYTLTFDGVGVKDSLAGFITILDTSFNFSLPVFLLDTAFYITIESYNGKHQKWDISDDSISYYEWRDYKDAYQFSPRYAFSITAVERKELYCFIESFCFKLDRRRYIEKNSDSRLYTSNNVIVEHPKFDYKIKVQIKGKFISYRLLAFLINSYIEKRGGYLRDRLIIFP